MTQREDCPGPESTHDTADRMENDLLDAWSEDFDSPPPPPSTLPRLPVWATVAIVGTLLLALGLWVILGPLGHRSGEGRLYLTGPHVEKLQSSQRVILGNRVVGQVTEVGMRNRALTATVELDRPTMDQLSTNASFYVGSLNKWIPGNLGVRIVPPTSQIERPPMPIGADVRLSATALPPSIPTRFWLLIGSCVLLFVVLGVCARMLHALYSFIKVIHGLIIALFLIAALLVYLRANVLPPDLLPLPTLHIP